MIFNKNKKTYFIRGRIAAGGPDEAAVLIRDKWGDEITAIWLTQVFDGRFGELYWFEYIVQVKT